MGFHRGRLNRNFIADKALSTERILLRQVDALLEAAAMSQALSYVVLSGLLEQVSYRKDWERAEILWAIFMRKGIEPNLICVLARAKVHLLAGRPTAVLEILQGGMAGCGSCFEENGRLVVEYAQSLLIASHSSLDPQVLHHLREFLESGHFSIEEKTSASTRNALKQMKALAETLLSDPRDLRLHDLLVEWKPKEMSVMATWDNLPAGTKYLDDMAILDAISAESVSRRCDDLAGTSLVLCEANLSPATLEVASKMERPMFRAFVSSVAGQKFLEAAKQENLAMQAVAMNSSMIDELTQTIQNSSNEESMKAFFASPSESTAAALNLQPLLEACAKCMSCAAQPRVANLGSCDEMLKTCSTVMTKLLKSLRKAVSEEMNQVCMTISKKQAALQSCRRQQKPAWYDPVSVAKAPRGCLSPRWDLAAPNCDELLAMLGKPPGVMLDWEEGLPSALRAAIVEALSTDSGFADRLLLSLGPRGCVLASRADVAKSSSSNQNGARKLMPLVCFGEHLRDLSLDVAAMLTSDDTRKLPLLHLQLQEPLHESGCELLWYRLLKPADTVRDVTGAGDALLAG
ncbi:hypothetical protein AK812_SmicGene18362, partial [Symbiodinium microadriaticum]